MGRRPAGLSSTWLTVYCLLTCLSLTAGQAVTITEPANPNPVLLIGRSFNLQCAYPDHVTVSLTHKESRIHDSEGRVLTHRQSGSHAIVVYSVDSVTEQDAGKYTCRNNADYSDYSEVTLTVNAPGPDVKIIDPEEEEITLEEGRDLTLRCEGGDNAQIEWKHNGMPLMTGSRVIITTARNIVYQRWYSLLTRTSVSGTEGGTYECYDRTDFFNTDKITVKVAPSGSDSSVVDIVEPPGGSLRITPGEAFTLRCRGDQNSQLEWLKDGMLLIMTHGGDQFVVSFSEDVTTGNKVTLLTKDVVTVEDAGKYKCQDGNNRQDADDINIHVIEQGDLEDEGPAPTEQRSITLRVGDSINMQCNMQGGDHMETQWSKDDQIISSGTKYSIKQSMPATLKIQNADRTDVGIYKCTFRYMDSGRVGGIVVFNVTTSSCIPLLPPQHGTYAYCPENPVFGEACTFSCYQGYTLTHERPLVCGVDDTPNWSEEVPKCRDISTADWVESVSGGHIECDTSTTDWLESDSLESDTDTSDSLEFDTTTYDSLESGTATYDSLETDTATYDSLETDTATYDSLESHTSASESLESDSGSHLISSLFSSWTLAVGAIFIVCLL